MDELDRALDQANQRLGAKQREKDERLAKEARVQAARQSAMAAFDHIAPSIVRAIEVLSERLRLKGPFQITKGESTSRDLIRAKVWFVKENGDVVCVLRAYTDASGAHFVDDNTSKTAFDPAAIDGDPVAFFENEFAKLVARAFEIRNRSPRQ